MMQSTMEMHFHADKMSIVALTRYFGQQGSIIQNMHQDLRQCETILALKWNQSWVKASARNQGTFDEIVAFIAKFADTGPQNGFTFQFRYFKDLLHCNTQLKRHYPEWLSPSPATVAQLRIEPPVYMAEAWIIFPAAEIGSDVCLYEGFFHK